MSCPQISRTNHRFSQGLLCSIAWLSLSGASVAQSQNQGGAGRHFDHVIIVVLENEGSAQALKDPYMGSLVRQGAWFSNYQALAHPSFPNYVALVAGSTFGIEHDHIDAPLKSLSIVDRLEDKGLSWKGYAENYPGHCFLGSVAGSGKLTPTAKPTPLYAKKHVPLLAFESVRTNPTRCAKVVDANEFTRDLSAGKLPNYAFYTPNVFNDGHDTSLAISTIWLKSFVSKIRAAPNGDRTLLVITWDEGGDDDVGHNHVLALFLGAVVNPGRYDAQLTHYSILRTIEDNFGLEPVNDGDRHARPVPESVWR